MTVQQIQEIVVKAKKASYELAVVPSKIKDTAIRKMAEALENNSEAILKANKKDLTANKGLSKPLLERLSLSAPRINLMAESLREVVSLKDPVGEVIAGWQRPNGLWIQKVRVPIGLIAIIYESRPNVTSDCAALCLKSGNACILRGGREAIHTNSVLFNLLDTAAKRAGIPDGALQFIDTPERKALQYLLALDSYIDLVIPRGGEGLISFVQNHSKIPVIKHYKGICHVYVDEYADCSMAEAICFNAKVQRPGVCNAMETLLVHKNIARRFLPSMVRSYHDAQVEVRGCPATRAIVKGITRATESDWSTEYLDLILSVKVVENIQEAIEHINHYGSRHSESIVTENYSAALRFLQRVDSACVYVNASTRFTDGYEFGMGAEIGISTDKIHARGPMALEELTTYKYMIFGNGQIRT